MRSRWTTVAVATAVALVATVCNPASAQEPEPTTPRVLDGFERADAASLGVAPTGQSWSVLFGGFRVAGGRAVPAGGYSVAVVDGGSGDGSVSATVAELGPEFWLVVRGSGPGDYWRFGRWQSGPYQLQQVKGHDLGSPVITTSATVTPSAGDRLECRLTAASMTCTVGGTLVASTTDGFNRTATLTGLASYSSGATALAFDDLAVEDLESGPDVAASVVGSSPVLVGGTVSWTATVTNRGDTVAPDVAMSAVIPAGVSGVSATANVGSCTVGSSIGCQVGSLAPGASATVAVRGTAPSTPGEVVLTPVFSTPGDQDLSDNSARATIVVTAPASGGARVLDGFERADAASLGVAPTGQSWSVLFGGFRVAGGRAVPAGGYSVAVVDGGSGDGSVSATVAELGPEFWLVLRGSGPGDYWRFGRWQSGPYQLQQVKGHDLGSPVITTSATVTPSAGDRLECRLTAASMTCTVGGTLVASTTDGFNRTATLTGFASYSSGATALAFDDLAVEDLGSGPDVAASVVGSSPVLVGGTVSWTATVTNRGDAVAPDVAMSAVIPAGVSGVSATANVGSCTVGSSIGCQVGSLAPGASATVTVRGTAPSTPGEVVLTPVFSTPGDQDLSDNSARATIVVTAPASGGARVLDGFERADAASLGVAPTGQSWSVLFGGFRVAGGRAVPAGGYSVAVVDGGSGDGSVSATVAELGPEFWLVLRGSGPGDYWRFGRWQSGPYQLQQVKGHELGSPVITTSATVTPSAGDRLECSLTAASMTCTVGGTLVASTTDGFNRTATLTGFASYSSGATALAFDDLAVEDLGSGPDVAASVVGSSPVLVGGTVSWTATVTNRGDAVAPDVAMSAVIPAGVSGVSATANVGSCTVGSSIGCQVGSLAPGASATVAVSGTAPSTPGEVVLTPVFSTPGDQDLSDNSARATIVVTAPASGGARVLDGFERADAASLGVAPTGQSWSVLFGGFRVAGGRAVPAGGYSVAVVDGGSGDGSVSATVAELGPEFWLVLRGSGPGDYWRFGRWQSGPYQLQQVKGHDLGSPVITTSATVTPSAGDRLECRFGGAAISCSVDGVLVSGALGAEPTARSVGLASYSSGTTALAFDDLKVVDLAAPTPDAAIELTDDDPILTGGELQWQALVSSVGTAATGPISLEVSLPAGLTGVDAEPAQGSCTVGASVICDVGTVAPGSTTLVTVTALAPGAADVLSATASITASGDENSGNDVATEETTVYAQHPSGGGFVDTFSRSGTSLGVADSGQPWSAPPGAFTTDGATVRSTTSEPSLAQVDAGVAFGTFEVTVSDVGDRRFWAAFRIIDPLNYFRVGPDGAGIYRLEKVVDGVPRSVEVFRYRRNLVAQDGDVIRIINRPDDSMFVSVNDQHLMDAGDVASMHAVRFGFVTASTSVRIDTVSMHPLMSAKVSVLDSFDRPDADEVGSPDSGVSYPWHGTLAIRDQQLCYLGSYFGFGVVDVSSEAADVSVRVDQISDEFDLVFRYSEDGKYYRFGRLGAGRGYGVDVVDGYSASPPPVPVQIVSTPTPADGDLLEVRQELDGKVEALVNGAVVLRFDDDVTNLRSTYYGVSTGPVGARFDDFSVIPE